MNDLAKRAVACKGWRWMPGMRLIHPTYGLTRVPVVDGDRGVWVVKEKVRALEYLHTRLFNEIEGCLPDLDDPATLGCLLALVREAWGDSAAYVECIVTLGEFSWSVVLSSLDKRPKHKWRGTSVSDGDSQNEALVAALEAAP